MNMLPSKMGFIYFNTNFISFFTVSLTSASQTPPKNVDTNKKLLQNKKEWTVQNMLKSKHQGQTHNMSHTYY